MLYLSTDTNNRLTATLEGATFAPGLEDIKAGRTTASLVLSSAYSCSSMVHRQGQSATSGPQQRVSDGASPLNVLGGIPSVATDYSPIWDLNPAVWTQRAIELGYRSRMTEEFAILGMVQKGWVTGLDGKKFGSVGLMVDCPIVYRFL